MKRQNQMEQITSTIVATPAESMNDMALQSTMTMLTEPYSHDVLPRNFCPPTHFFKRLSLNMSLFRKKRGDENCKILTPVISYGVSFKALIGIHKRAIQSNLSSTMLIHVQEDISVG